MTAHADSHAPVVSAEIPQDGGDERLKAALALKFEPIELEDFALADKAAGQMMGKLLAFLFCVLLFLMTGVNLWMVKNAAKGTDPQAPVGVTDHSDQSKAAAHH